MVAAQNSYSIFVSDFKADKESDCFYRVVASVDVITQKEVVSVRRVATYVELLILTYSK